MLASATLPSGAWTGTVVGSGCGVVFFSLPDDRGGDDGYFGDEAVTLPDHGLNKARLVGIITQNEPQLVYCSVNTVLRILQGILAPKPTVDGFPANKLSVALSSRMSSSMGILSSLTVRPDRRSS